LLRYELIQLLLKEVLVCLFLMALASILAGISGIHGRLTSKIEVSRSKTVVFLGLFCVLATTQALGGLVELRLR